MSDETNVLPVSDKKQKRRNWINVDGRDGLIEQLNKAQSSTGASRSYLIRTCIIRALPEVEKFLKNSQEGVKRI